MRTLTVYFLQTPVTSVSPRTGETVTREKLVPTPLFIDIIGPSFWEENPHLLE